MRKTMKYLLIILLIGAIILFAFLFRPIATKPINTATNAPVVDVVLIGGGIMSATLGTYLNRFEPNWNIQMIERLDQVALESSKALNNAGTGHSGFMEMNYTSKKDGKMDVSKAVQIAEQFEVSKQFWADQVKQGVLNTPTSFIHPVPHIAFVWTDNVNFLKNRYDAMVKHPLFAQMQYTQNPEIIKAWAPLIIQGRDPNSKIAATRMDLGTDVDYGAITSQLVHHLEQQSHFQLKTSSEVTGISRNKDLTWNVRIKNLKTGAIQNVKTRFVFIGAGGAALRLLQMTGLKESQQYAGFPIGGSFLITDDPAVTDLHTAKVYGRAELGAPPMSVPHIDTRYIDGKKYVLFGPFATYSNKFLKHGSQLDLLNSTNKNNVIPMSVAGFENLDLLKYLVQQVAMSQQDQFNELKKYYPEAKYEDWQLIQAGQRVQIIKKLPNKASELQFGTEIFVSPDRTVAALLGASPGASTSPYIMLNLMEQAFPEKMAGPWHATIHEIIPSYKQDLDQNPALLNRIRIETSQVLGLNYLPTPSPQVTKPKYAHAP